MASAFPFLIVVFAVETLGQAQKFLAAAELIYQPPQPKRHRLPAFVTKRMRLEQTRIWREMTEVSVSI